MFINLIENRRSVRSFKNMPICEEDFEKISDLLKGLNGSVGPFGNRAEFKHMPVSNHINPEGEHVGTYGVIRNPAGYIIGITKNDRQCLIDFGYIFEKFMLEILAFGIGTCWLGGTFDRKMISNKFENNNSYIIPSITPIGYHDDKPSLIERTMRKLAGSDHKFEFEDVCFKGDLKTPLTREDAANLEIPLEMIRIGPSASNKQPWRMVVEGEKVVHFFIKHTPNYSKRLKFDIQYLDIGIAMCHFKTAVDEIGMKGHWNAMNALQIAIDDQHMEYVMSYIFE